eukprot:8995043-Lingulodinium_polyedra.AAC.1
MGIIGHIPKPEGQPEGTVYRAQDLERPDVIRRRARVRVALRIIQFAIVFGVEHYVREHCRWCAR